jgi:XTP/dITP diphosphohydrolase
MTDYAHIQPSDSFDDLIRLMHILRNECPWDKKQTHESLKDLMVEEVYEAIDAIDRRDFDELRKELGDMLLHVVFHAEMAGETKNFTIHDVILTLQTKLINRHPHIFGDTKVDGVDQVLKNWEAIKMTEGGRKSVLEGVPGNLPGLIRAQRMQEKAAGVGFDWKEWTSAFEKLEEELKEFREAGLSGNKADMSDEFGDVMFSVVNVGRLMGLDAEDSLRLTNTKFQRRFEYIEAKLAELGKTPAQSDLVEMDRLWDEAKRSTG